MSARILPFPGAMSDDELLRELGVDVDDSLYLKPGETVADRIPAKLARGRAIMAQARRKAFRAV